MIIMFMIIQWLLKSQEKEHLNTERKITCCKVEKRGSCPEIKKNE